MTVTETPGIRAGRRGSRPYWLAAIGLVLSLALAVAAVELGRGGLSDVASGAEITTTVAEGPFQLTLRSASARYEPGEAIDISASLTYRGPQARIEIGHDEHGPLAFGIREPVFDAIEIGTMSNLMCGQSTLVRGVPFTQEFLKGGSFDGSNPAAESFKAYVIDPVLWLPAGTWHIDALATLGPSCHDQTVHLRAELAIVVSDDPTVTPGPWPTPTGQGAAPIGDDQSDGPWQIGMTAFHRQVRAGEPIPLSIGLGYYGEESVETFGSSTGRLEIGVRQLYSDRQESMALAEGCEPQGPVTFTNDRLEIPVRLPTYAPGGVLRLPVGVWQIWARTAFYVDPGCTSGPKIAGSVVVEVVP